jgi:hypothetical protein
MSFVIPFTKHHPLWWKDLENLPEKRIILTGDRYYSDGETIRGALLQAWYDLGSGSDILLIEGECPYGGADIIGRNLWIKGGFPVLPMPADITEDGRILGPARNQRMVDVGANLCLAFPTAQSRGTRNCIRLAKAAGIDTRIYEGTR